MDYQSRPACNRPTSAISDDVWSFDDWSIELVGFVWDWSKIPSNSTGKSSVSHTCTILVAILLARDVAHPGVAILPPNPWPKAGGFLNSVGCCSWEILGAWLLGAMWGPFAGNRPDTKKWIVLPSGIYVSMILWKITMFTAKRHSKWQLFNCYIKFPAGNRIVQNNKIIGVTIRNLWNTLQKGQEMGKNAVLVLLDVEFGSLVGRLSCSTIP